jgi:hypothetical protein
VTAGRVTGTCDGSALWLTRHTTVSVIGYSFKYFAEQTTNRDALVRVDDFFLFFFLLYTGMSVFFRGYESYKDAQTPRDDSVSIKENGWDNPHG